MKSKQSRAMGSERNVRRTISSPRKRIFIVEDHPVFREGLKLILVAQEDMEVCGVAVSAEEALPAIISLKPDLALVDISLPGKSGIELIGQIRAKKLETKLLVVSMHAEALYADRVLRAGGDGYIMKEEDPGEIVHAIRDVLAGHIYVSDEVLASRSKPPSKAASRKPSRPLSQLTDAELEVLELIGRRFSRHEIARELHLTPRAVAERCAQIERKMNLPSDEALARSAVNWVQS
jgi:DNA-binding NarL/FixJ family response regulator